MTTDPIDRRDAKDAIKYLADLQREFATHYKWHTRDLHLVAAGSHDEDIEALDKLPALDADGRWEKLYKWISAWHGRMDKIADNPDDSAHNEAGYAAHALSCVLSRMEEMAAPPATERRPAVERPQRTFFQYVEQEAARSGLPAITVLTNEWAAFNKLKDDSLWPSDNDLPNLTSEREE
jgi:hypothetical protein